MDYKYLKNNRNLKAFFREATSSEIEGILDKIKDLYDEVKEKEEQQEKARQARLQFLSGVLDSLDSHNFTVEDLAALKNQVNKESRPKMLPRYRYININGEERFWSGQGKIPKELKEVMLRDGITDKNNYLIRTDNSD